MATRDYWLRFGSGNPGTVSGLAPTFITFIDSSGGNVIPPAITEPGSKGLYKFAYDPTQTIAFTVDGATTGLATSDRYIAGVLDAQDTFGVTLNAIGVSQVAMGSTISGMAATLVAIGTSFGVIAGLIGTTASSFGDNTTDPSTLFGFMKRIQELNEGNQDYTKASGALRLFSRGAGTTTLLRSLTVSDTATLTTKG